MRNLKLAGIAALIAGSASVMSAQTVEHPRARPHPNVTRREAHEIRSDKREIRRDNRELRSDTHEIRQDRREIRQDTRESVSGSDGDYRRFAASSARSLRSPFDSTMCAATFSPRNLSAAIVRPFDALST